MNRSHAPAAIALVALATVLGHVEADITHNEWNANDDFHFHVNYMPDLDQKRFALPANGDMFCVPTSQMNLFAYAAEWGYPSLDPGEGVWQGDVPYSDLTGALSDLGVLMSTGTTGTGVNGWLNGMENWLADQPLTYSAQFRTEDWCPTLSDAALSAAFGAVVNICFGRYEFNPAPEPIVASSPNSGHCVTVVHAEADGSDEELWVRDPGGDDDIFTQSQWATTIYDSVETRSVLQDWDEDSAYFPVDVTILNYNPDATLIRFIHKVYAMFPTMGYTYDGVELNIDPISDDLWNGVPQSQNFQPPAGFQIAGVDMSAIGLQMYVLVSNGEVGQLEVADPRTGDLTTIANIDDAPTQIAVGRHREVSVLVGPEVRRYHLDGTLMQVMELPWVGQAMAYCDDTDELFVISTIDGEMAAFFDGDPEPVMYDLPAGVPASAAPSIALREADCAIGILTPENDDVIYGVRVPKDGPLEFMEWEDSGLAATGIFFDDRDHLIVSSADGSVRDLVRDTGWWSFDDASSSWYADVETLGQFRVSRSRTNYRADLNADDDVDTPPDQLELLGTVVYDCLGDFDNDLAIGVGDLLILLANWGACGDCTFDLDNSGSVDVGDLLGLIGRWGPCPTP